MSSIALLFWGWLAAALFMSVLWLVQRRTNNAGVVDVGWAFSIGALAVAFAALGTGDLSHRAAAAIMGGVWGLRLASHIHRRSHGQPEDGRYQQLRREWGDRVQSRMFRFYQLQALTVAFFALPFLLMAQSPRLGLGAVEWIGFLLCALAVPGEALADAQLDAFKHNPENHGQVCRVGLWNWSRHPNYFFEWLTWCGIALFALPSPWGWVALLCPASILFLLLRVTGIPATEAQAIRSRGDAYREYQRTTSAFIPWFPRRPSP